MVTLYRVVINTYKSVQICPDVVILLMTKLANMLERCIVKLERHDNMMREQIKNNFINTTY